MIIDEWRADLMKAMCEEKVICENVENANTFIKRFKGLMGRKSLDENAGLLLDPCNQIHTFGMKFAIDTITLGKNNEILFIDDDVKPGKIRPIISKGKKVLELPSGTAKKNMLQVGQVILMK